MRASRIFCLARTSRCAIVGKGTRKLRATSSVVSPHKVRSVSATCASSASAGWQQVKISRSRSSPNGSSSVRPRCISSSVPASCCSRSAILCSSSRLESNRARRRSRSTPLCCAVETSHARGRSLGRPLLERRSERLLHYLLRQVKASQQADQRGQNPSQLFAEDVLDVHPAPFPKLSRMEQGKARPCFAQQSAVPRWNLSALMESGRQSRWPHPSPWPQSCRSRPAVPWFQRKDHP